MKTHTERETKQNNHQKLLFIKLGLKRVIISFVAHISTSHINQKTPQHQRIALMNDKTAI